MKRKTNKNIQIKTIFGTFNCLFESNAPDKGYTVTCFKVPGVVTFGLNLSDAKRYAKEALELHCECLIEEGIAKLKINNKALA